LSRNDSRSSSRARPWSPRALATHPSRKTVRLPVLSTVRIGMHVLQPFRPCSRNHPVQSRTTHRRLI